MLLRLLVPGPISLVRSHRFELKKGFMIGLHARRHKVS